MFSFLSRLGSPSGSPEGRRSSLARSDSPTNWSADYASDPSQWEATFEKCWNRSMQLLERKEMDPEHEITYEEMTQLLSQLSHMCKLLMMEVNSQPEPAIGPILDRYFTQQILERVLDWAIQIADFHKPICQLSLIRIYEAIVGESHTQNHCLLVHKPILNPLLRLFDWCKRVETRRPNNQTQPSSRDKHFVLLLNQICTKLAEDKTLLHFFFSCSEGSSDQFAVFSLLIPFLYEQNDVGQLARDALLLILSVSSKHEMIAEFVAMKSAFCPVVATGLSGCFSQLPRVLAPEGSDRLVPDHATESLANFNSSIVFCNAVVQAAHPSVVEQICNYFYSGFLLSVVKPALLQEEREAVAASASYLQVCLEAVSEPVLLRTIVRMLLLERDDQMRPLIQVIVQRIRDHDRLASVSIQLLDCLLGLGIEDVMLVLVLRHLLPLRHSTKAQLQRCRDSQHTAAVAQKLLDCVPNCMLRFNEISSASTLGVYLQEGSAAVEKCAAICSVWKWRYDGVNPSPLLFRGDSDEEFNGHSAFSRLSSCRSSMSSAQHGLNRYFASRTNHLTAESAALGRLVELGGSPEGLSTEDTEDCIEEDDEFVLPPINTSSIMTSSMVDYFQLSTLDDMSDSEDSPSSPERKAQNRKKAGAIRLDSVSLPSETDSSIGTARGFDTDAEMARSFVLTGWAEVEDMDTFVSLLDRQPISRSAGKVSVAECMSFIDSKMQYWEENQSNKDINKEDQDLKQPANSSDSAVTASRGQPIEEGADGSIFLDFLLGQLESMCDHSLMYNLHLASLVSSLAAYPQPLLTAYLFDMQHSDRYPQLIEILSSLKTRIDSMTSSIESLDVWVQRALRTLNSRAERADRLADPMSSRHGDSPREETFSPISSFLRGRNFGNSGRRPTSGIRYHSHKVVESPESARDDERTKNTVHAAIVLANLCQYLAGIALHQSLVVVRQSNTGPI